MDYKLSDVHFPDADEDWRSVDIPEEDDDEDVEAPQYVIDLLGFNPDE